MSKNVPNYIRPVGMGHMRTQVQIQAGTFARGVEGEEYDSGWATITNGTLWAEVVPLRGDEAFQAQQVFGSEVIQFRTRYLSTVTVEHRLLHNSVQLDIVEVLDPGFRHRELLIRCIERKGVTV